MEHLKDTLKYLTQEESRLFLKQFYTGAYKLGMYRPTGSVDVWFKILDDKIFFKKALDVGCGLGWGIKMCRDAGRIAFGIDLASTIGKDWEEREIKDYCLSADANHLPFKANSFDLVVCNDVLEHIPEFNIDSTINEIRRVGSDKFAFSIALTDECYPMMGKIHTHITVRLRSWWEDKFDKNSFFIIANIKQIWGDVNHYFIYAVKDKNPYLVRERVFHD